MKPIFVADEIRQDVIEIIDYLAEMRSRTGYGSLVVVMHAAEVYEINLTIKRRPKAERKKTQ